MQLLELAIDGAGATAGGGGHEMIELATIHMYAGIYERTPFGRRPADGSNPPLMVVSGHSIQRATLFKSTVYRPKNLETKLLLCTTN